MNRASFAGKRVLVVGLGASGFAAARALVSLDAKVYVTEAASSAAIEERADILRQQGADVETGGHRLDLLHGDLAVVSPGIAPTAPVIVSLRQQDVPVIGEVELAFQLSDSDFLAVTGTNGKTTTTSLLAAMLTEAGVATAAAGNIGLPLVDAVLTMPPRSVIALEISSFQLAAIDRFRPRVAVLLNLAEDHTDWHGSTDAYAAAKARIVENQRSDDVFLPNADDAFAMSVARLAPARVVPFSARGLPEGGIGTEDGSIVWKGRRLLATEEVPLTGLPGLEDALAASGAALEFGLPEQAVVRAIKAFRPLSHRLELVAHVDGVAYIDDSKATNPHASIAAIEGLSDVVLIAGGRAKGVDLSPLATTVPPVRAVVALGEAAEQVARVFEGLVPVDRAASMEEAVRLAQLRSVPGGSVLLSPGCASLDMYSSYAQRGERFAAAVRQLLAGRKS